MKTKPLELTSKIDRKEIQLEGQYEVTDCWNKQKQDNTSQIIKRDIPAHDVAVYRLFKK